MDTSSRQQILRYANHVMSKIGNPRTTGKALTGKLSGLWRYRTGNYRLICQIRDQELVILVITIGHRKDIYDE